METTANLIFMTFLLIFVIFIVNIKASQLGNKIFEFFKFSI